MDSFLYDSDDSNLPSVSFKRIVVPAVTCSTSSSIPRASQDFLDTNVEEIEESINNVLSDGLNGGEHSSSPVPSDADDDSVDECEEVPFGSILDKVVANNCSGTIQQQINALYDEWKQLDEQYLIPLDSKLMTIALPAGFDYKSLEDIDDIDDHLTLYHELYHHPRFPKDISEKKEYLSKLFHLFRSVPKVCLVNDIFSSSALETVKLLRDPANRQKLTNDTSMNEPEYVLFDEDRAKKRRRRNSCGCTNAAAESTHSNPPIVYTIGLFSITTHAIQQRLQLLGHHTLSQLKDLLYCVQSEVHGTSNWDGIHPSSDDQQNNGYYFYMDGGFYYDHSCSISQQMVDKVKDSLKSIFQNMKDDANNAAQIMQTEAVTEQAPKRKRKGPFQASMLAASLLEKMGESQNAPIGSTNLSNISTDKRGSIIRKRKASLGIVPPPPLLTPTVDISPYHGTVSWSDGISFANVPSSKDITLDQLNIKAGVPYLFSHCGGCEHLLVVTEIRDYHESLDGRDCGQYPSGLSTVYGKKRKCQGCDGYGAAYIVFNDRLAETSPCFLCKICYQSLHYDSSGKLLYDDFCVYPYLQDMS